MTDTAQPPSSGSTSGDYTVPTRRDAGGKYPCQNCDERFDTSLRLYRHRLSHQTIVSVRFFNRVTLEFKKIGKDRVVCRCGKNLTIINLCSVHKYSCEACIAEARRKLVALKPSDVPDSLPKGRPMDLSRVRMLRKSDIAYITNAAEPVEEYDTKSPLGKVGMFFHHPTQLLVCGMCKWVVLTRTLAKHFSACVKNTESARTALPSSKDISVAKFYLESCSTKPRDFSSFRDWLESCEGKAIPRIPVLPVIKIKKCTVCGYLCLVNQALSTHMRRIHGITPTVSKLPVLYAQRLLPKGHTRSFVEVSVQQETANLSSAEPNQDMDTLVELRELLGYN